MAQNACAINSGNSGSSGNSPVPIVTPSLPPERRAYISETTNPTVNMYETIYQDPGKVAKKKIVSLLRDPQEYKTSRQQDLREYHMLSSTQLDALGFYCVTDALAIDWTFQVANNTFSSPRGFVSTIAPYMSIVDDLASMGLTFDGVGTDTAHIYGNIDFSGQILNSATVIETGVFNLFLYYSSPAIQIFNNPSFNTPVFLSHVVSLILVNYPGYPA
jgi:hypothetical protein